MPLLPTGCVRISASAPVLCSGRAGQQWRRCAGAGAVVARIGLPGQRGVAGRCRQPAAGCGARTDNGSMPVANAEPIAAGGRWRLIVDGLFGIGLARPLADRWHSAVRWINAQPAPVLALDIPSGLHAETGEVLGAAVGSEMDRQLHRQQARSADQPRPGPCRRSDGHRWSTLSRTW